jgi:hypothetical protein
MPIVLKCPVCGDALVLDEARKIGLIEYDCFRCLLTYTYEQAMAGNGFHPPEK